MRDDTLHVVDGLFVLQGVKDTVRASEDLGNHGTEYVHQVESAFVE